ncbi:MAG: hypothetical protein ACFE8A_08800 [Candidatus Hodarchaeota archaeon]
MIQGILSFQFVLNQTDKGEISPEFRPIQVIFKEGEELFTKDNFADLIIENDLFATFYQHTTGIYGEKGPVSNFYTGRLKETPYQVLSYFRQEKDGSQFITIAIFELDDEIELFEDMIKDLATRLDVIFQTLLRAQNSRQISQISNVNIRLANELKFTIFQIERLMRLDKLQKVALIYNSLERLKILEILRERPILKEELKSIIEKLKPTINIDILLRPFLELNLIRRDWSKGEKDKETGIIRNQGEYLFLVKDIVLARVPSEYIINHLKESKIELFELYKQKVIEFFSNYDPLTEPIEETRKLAAILLNPDIYDFFALLRSNYYPFDKIPKVFSDFAVTEILLDNLKKLNVITEITVEEEVEEKETQEIKEKKKKEIKEKKKEERKWILLLTDIEPLIIFPEYILPFIRESFKSDDKKVQISHVIAKKAYDLLEVTFPEKVEF